MSEDAVISTSGLAKRYGRTEALTDLSVEVHHGEVFGFLGPNGAGKTTTLRLLMGLLRPSSGAAHIAGLDTWRRSVQVHELVGYVPGEPALYPRLTGEQHIEYLGHLRGPRMPPSSGEVSERLQLDLTRPAGDLSRGNRQKLALVLAMMSDPEVLLLDEPTSGLDPIAQQQFRELLRERVRSGATVFLSSHVLGEVQRMADRVGVLRAGHLVAVERLEELRGRALHHVRATFAEPPPPDIVADVGDLIDVRSSDHTLTCKAPEQALDALLKAVSRYTVADFDCTEAELEETFLAFYGEEEAGRAQ